MVAKRVARSFGFLWLATGAIGCGQPEGGEVGTTEIAVVAENGLTANGLTANGLTANGLTANGLTANGLTANGLTANGLTANGLTANGLTANGLTANGLTAGAMTDPLSRQLMKYIVSCALSEQQSLSLTIAGTAYTFPGSIGLAPQWGTTHGSCDGSCQRWVSACVLARVDAAGIDREISIRGANLALLPTSWSELSQYSQREATYFGNIFIPGQPRFLCLSPGQTEDERACGPSLADCPMTVLGSCSRDCLFQGLFGDFDLCSDAGRVGTGNTYLESVTVYLPK
jgi:GLTT repeat (6 copies)